MVGKGNNAAAVLAERAIDEFQPTALLFVGIAGALRGHLALGDVVVASHVYAYHGATSDNDGMKARPRVWEIPHETEQIARHVARTAEWARGLDPRPTVRFGPIAAGEVAQYSATGSNATWLDSHYNDALAIEMEGAGVAQAAHFNHNLPVAVIRGISDFADNTKTTTDAAGWQAKAVTNAAAFALALADALTTEADTNRHSPTNPARRQPMTTHFHNVNYGNSWVGIQGGNISASTIHISGSVQPARHDDFTTQLAEVRKQLQEAHQAGHIDQDLYKAATDEVTSATAASDKQTRRFALKRLKGLISDIAPLSSVAAAVATLLKELG